MIGTIGSSSGGRYDDLLHRPPVAVRVLEPDEPAPRLLVDVGALDSAPTQVGECLIGIGSTTTWIICENPSGIISSPVPKQNEQADPGGVTCTNRSPSCTFWS